MFFKMQCCRICLMSNTRLYAMKQFNLYENYEYIIGLSAKAGDKLPNKICWECFHRLKSCLKFKDKAIRSYGIMIDILNAKHCLTQKSLLSIDRTEHGLASTLATKSFIVNHNDLHIHETAISNDEYLKWTDEKLEINTLDLEVGDENSDIKVCKDEEISNKKDCDNNYGVNNYEDNNYDDNNISTSSSDILPKKKRKELTKTEKSPKIDKRRRPAKQILNEDIFLITELSIEEQILEINKRKDSSNYKSSKYQCNDCFKGFLEEDAYKCHIMRHNVQSGSYICEICKVRFKTQHALRNHVASHMQKFTCRRCPYVTTRKQAAKLHEEYHNGTRYSCPHCQEDFGKFSTYMTHIRLKHPSDFVCEQCGYSFISVKGLSLHKKLKHRSDELPVPPDGPYCELCDVRFISEEARTKHLKLSARHSNDISESKLNGNRISSQQSTEEKETAQKKKSKRTFKPEGPIQCEQCEIQLPDSISYYRHFRRTHPDKNRTNYPSMKTKCMCEVCGRMFQSLALLQDHSFTHSDSKQFKCSQCGKCFQRKYRLIAHRRLHLAQRASYACGSCGKRFTTTSNMQRHMVGHTGLKPFKCEMCGKCFKHASEKRVHVTYVHLKKPWPKRSRGKRRADSRQGQVPSQAVPSDLDVPGPLWPPCHDPKGNDAMEKTIYYNLKI